MARRIRIPWLADLLTLDQPAEIRAVIAHPALDRDFAARGPLVNRLITGRIRRWLALDGRPLPALAPRGDRLREQRQESLAAELDPDRGRLLWTHDQLGRLADYVAGRTGRDQAGIAVQEIVGRCFDPGYRADAASWEAARTLDDWRDGGVRYLLRDLWWAASGRLRRATELLAERAGDDRHAMHGTAIGVHGIVDALERMRALRATAAAGSIDAATAVARCLQPPRRVLRSVEAPLPVAFADPPLRPGSLVMLDLAEAGARAPDPDIVFMQGRWSFCPAMRLVPALLRAAWEASAGTGRRP